MKLIRFKEMTVTYAENQSQYLPAPAYKVPADPEGRIICCWSLNIWERLIVLFTGKVWHQILTFNKPLQPQLLTVEKPDMEKDPYAH